MGADVIKLGVESERRQMAAVAGICLRQIAVCVTERLRRVEIVGPGGLRDAENGP